MFLRVIAINELFIRVTSHRRVVVLTCFWPGLSVGSSCSDFFDRAAVCCFLQPHRSPIRSDFAPTSDSRTAPRKHGLVLPFFRVFHAADIGHMRHRTWGGTWQDSTYFRSGVAFYLGVPPVGAPNGESAGSNGFSTEHERLRHTGKFLVCQHIYNKTIPHVHVR